MLLLSYSKYAWVPLWWCIRFGFSLALNGWIFSLRTQGVSRLTNVSSQNPGRREPVSSVQVEDRESWTGLHLLTLPLLRFPLEKPHWSICQRANQCPGSDHDISRFWSSVIAMLEYIRFLRENIFRVWHPIMLLPHHILQMQCTMQPSIAIRSWNLFKSNCLVFAQFWPKSDKFFLTGVKP